MTVDSHLLSLLVEPGTGYPLVLNKDKTALICRKSQKAYPIKDGIPILLPEHAIDIATIETKDSIYES